MKNTLRVCSWKDCKNDRAVSKTGKTKYVFCREHNNHYNREYNAKNPGRKAVQNSRYFAKREGHVYLDTHDGYEKYMGFNHPACSPSGLTRYHRIVLWNKLNGEDAPCTDCGRQLYWDKTQISNTLDELHVDHVNGITFDNRPENLEPICAKCNNTRARKMKEAAV